MTKQTRAKRLRRKFNFPTRDKIASLSVDHENGRFVLTTKDMIQNQLDRDGPRIRRSFDKLTRSDIAACSALFGEATGLTVRHLPNLHEVSFKATASRLLSSAQSTYLASIEVARHGYRRQYGMLARALIETIATVIVIAVKPTALSEFHAGNLKSTKCVGWAKVVLPPLGSYYGMLSDQFVHIGPAHAAFEPLLSYTSEDEALRFIVTTLRGNVWLLYLAAELVFHDEVQDPRYWKPDGAGVSFHPSESERRWMGQFLADTNTLSSTE